MRYKSSLNILFFSFAIVALIILSGIFIKYYLQKSTNRLLSEIDKIEVSINNNDWEKATKSIIKLNADWEITESKWTLFTNHHEIDNITITLKNSSEFIRAKDLSQALASLSSLKHYLSHIPDMENLSFKNIF